MMFKLELWIAIRYLLRGRKKEKLFSTVSLFSVLGIFFATLVPLIVLSVMSGFQKDIKDRILALDGHAIIYPISDKSMPFDEELEQKLLNIPGVERVQSIIEMQGMMDIFGEYKSVLIKGIDPKAFNEDPSYQKAFDIVEGSRDITHPYYILVGNEIKNTYFIDNNSRLKLVAVKQTGSITAAKTFQTQVVGSYKTGYLAYDRNVILTSKRTLEKEMGMEGEVSKVAVFVKNPWQMQEALNEIKTIMPVPTLTLTWQDEHESLFKAMKIERLLMWFIMLIIVVVAVFNVVNSQALLVVEKRQEIGILKTLGYTPSMILRIFLYESIILTVIGASMGLLVGSLILFGLEGILNSLEWLLNFFYGLTSYLGGGQKNHISIIPSNVYYIDNIPTDLSIDKVLVLFGFTLLTCAISGLLPAYSAAHKKTIDVIRQL